MQPVRSDQLRRRIQDGLSSRGIKWYSGLTGPTCQTGEEYQELYIKADSFDHLCSYMVGAILAFSSGRKKERCYWRIAPEYDGDQSAHIGYARFKITAQPELDM